ncbi:MULTISPECIES: adenine deaminase [unclassified Carboxylicivirga]|uniref:adenine deaminase n=1 Tax=Carboxylicivirga TaxID=1628153 RepID=UPI003D355E0D
MIIEGNIVDVHQRDIYPAAVHIEEGRIVKIIRTSKEYKNFILPGLVDSHVHIESSMLIPSRFAALVVPRGTVAIVSDPHEIANVNGVGGVEYMMRDAEKVPLKCFFGVPSCVPATDFETSGGRIEPADVEYLLKGGACFLAEMMNFPGVVHGDSVVKAKLDLAKQFRVPIDGHAPGLLGDDLKSYAQAGITTDHESATLEEAQEKIALGIKTQIREGSAARNFEALHPLIQSQPYDTMLCTDDSHPDLILDQGHIDRLIRLGLSKGYSIFDLYQAAVLNPVAHYNLPVGLLQEGDPADFIVVDTLEDFRVLSTYIDGKKVAEHGEANFNLPAVEPINNFNCTLPLAQDLQIIAPKDNPQVQILVAEDGDLLTDAEIWKPKIRMGEVILADPEQDIAKIIVLNRYKKAAPVVGFIKNFGLKKGAFAGSVAHDSHNIVAIGVDDDSLLRVIAAVINAQGGIAAANQQDEMLLELPIAGLMSASDGNLVAERYKELNAFVREMGCTLKAPFMTMAFMSLLVIPTLKIGDQGLFDVSTFKFTSLFIDE